MDDSMENQASVWTALIIVRTTAVPGLIRFTLGPSMVQGELASLDDQENDGYHEIAP